MYKLRLCGEILLLNMFERTEIYLNLEGIPYSFDEFIYLITLMIPFLIYGIYLLNKLD